MPLTSTESTERFPPGLEGRAPWRTGSSVSRKSQVVLAAEGVGDGLAGEFDEVGVVGEEEDLGSRAEFGEDGEGGAGAGVVEADEDVIDYEGQRVA